MEKMQLYKAIHKGQRRWLFDISTMMAAADFTSKDQVEIIKKEIKTFHDHLLEHVENEEKFIHPILDERAPGATHIIAAEHKVIHKDVEQVLSGLERHEKMSTSHEAYDTISYEIYLSWNRFISIYLRHIDIEEEQLQQILLNVCSAKELLEVFKSILGSFPPESLMLSLKIMVLGINDEELVALLNGAKFMVPPELSRNANKTAADLLGRDRWVRIEPRLA